MGYIRSSTFILSLCISATADKVCRLPRLQLRILQRAMRMLKDESDYTPSSESSGDAGRIVYSTCSFNPIENEAVVAAALNSVPGALADPLFVQSLVVISHLRSPRLRARRRICCAACVKAAAGPHRLAPGCVTHCRPQLRVVRGVLREGGDW